MYQVRIDATMTDVQQAMEGKTMTDDNNNTGYRNTGNWNTGNQNTGNRNTGNQNTGYRNTGDRNTGHWNTGYWNTGNQNNGDRNTGDRNTGNQNTGYRNTGDRNTGHRNTGNRNTGHRNTGNQNTGHRNTGNQNTGNWNTGHRNTGFFCVETPLATFFDAPTQLTFDEARSSIPFVDLPIGVVWVESSKMTDDEKSSNPNHNIIGGYLRKHERPCTETFPLAWAKMSEGERTKWKSLPNFDADKFKRITGVDVRETLRIVKVRTVDGDIVSIYADEIGASA